MRSCWYRPRNRISTSLPIRGHHRLAGRHGRRDGIGRDQRTQRLCIPTQLQIRKYRGGPPPWGYLPPNDTGEWRLIQDPVQVAVIQEVIERVLAVEPLRSVAHDLTDRKVLTPKDRFAEAQRREARGHGWHSAGLKRALMSQTLLGYAVLAREPLLDAQGRVQRDSKGQEDVRA
ncbi:recombinase family protein [Mycobacterium asiaticum]|uniref:recombinase family protein n=1 Tax=Mycobacterium asiaticum TaxID=1790 RepID=UPI0020A5DD8C|nr:recombinase family protein [Mycobacterium asiaticum]